VRVVGAEHQRVTDPVALDEHVGTDAIAEQFIPGRELYVSVVGNSLRLFRFRP